MKKRLVIGSRGSRLALIQAESVAAKIKKAHPDLEISISKITTAGDRDQRTQLEKMGIGAFVKELEKALIDNRIDIAVHSLKDLPTEIPAELCLLAVPERLDPRDVLIAKSKLDALAPGSRIATDSLRRAVQLKQIRPDLEICGIRGNVDTRVRKASTGEVDGVILAAASMLRLGWQDKITQYLSLTHFIPAVGQGALIVEGRADDEDTAGLVSPINNISIWWCVMAERAFLRALGGGCRAPIAALGTVKGLSLNLEGMVASINGENVLRASEEGDARSSEAIGTAMAKKMLRLGASEFIPGARCN